VPNGRTPESAHYVYKLEWFATLRTALEAELSQHAQLAVCGDFNVAPTDDDVWDPKLFVNSTHVTPARTAGPGRPARARADRRGAQADEGPASVYLLDYRAGAFAKDQGMRIDLVYASQAVADRVTGAYVDREAARVRARPTTRR